ncbi:3-oxoacyl-[acyl-carrier-protein] reductase [bacterium]|nr:MAG: 3-oxoacyl-[acyl-carrier-protein] reductase [bacterium]
MLEGKAAWITGAARGIGKVIAEQLAAHGANLAVTDLLEDELAATAAEIERTHSVKVIHQKLNVTDSVGAAEIVKRCTAELGGLTILVNNAGITKDGLMMRMSESDWDAVIAVNLKGTFICTQAAMKAMMKARYGKIVNIASVIGVMGNAGQANYAASKAGIIGLTKSVAKELASRGIRANAVAPGFIQTEMTGELAEDTKTEYLKAIPLNLLGTPQDVADACVFLSSPASDYITGQVLLVDGGMHM